MRKNNELIVEVHLWNNAYNGTQPFSTIPYRGNYKDNHPVLFKNKWKETKSMKKSKSLIQLCLLLRIKPALNKLVRS